MQEPSSGCLPTRLHFFPLHPASNEKSLKVLHRRLEIGYRLRSSPLVAARRTTVAGQETAEKAARAQRKRTLEPDVLGSKTAPPLPVCAGNHSTSQSPSVPTCERGLPTASPDYRKLGRYRRETLCEPALRQRLPPRCAPAHPRTPAEGRSPTICRDHRQLRARGLRPTRPAPLTSSRLRTTRTTRRQEGRSS